MRIIICLTIIIILIIGGGCNINEPGEFSPDTKVVFGESIARVQLWNDSSLVVKKLGRPNSIGLGDFKGYIFCYTEGTFAQTYVTFSTDRTLGLGVINVSVESPYSGRSAEGIGINSQRDFVISRLGLPHKTIGDTLLYDTYYYQKNSFRIVYDKQRIISITMTGRINK